jgi:hypothetical protein
MRCVVEVDPRSHPREKQGDEMHGDQYKVITTFCDDVVQEHDHEELKPATEEYAARLAEAVVPSMEHPDARHIKLVEFYALNDQNEEDQFCFSGPFDCDHKVVVGQ